jgi:hypothetical protein
VTDIDWVAAHLGAVVYSNGGHPLEELVGLALRHNPKRAHLLVSHVLGKHIPTEPGVVHGAGRELGVRVAAALADSPIPAGLVIGYAETATALGHCVAEYLGADYLHSTRRAVSGLTPVSGFREEHSHAAEHLLLPEWPDWLTRPGPFVLVDDEFSTGATALNTITELQRLHPRDRYVLACLVDLRSAEARRHIDAVAAQLGTRIDVVHLGSGSVELPDGFAERAAAIAADHETTAPSDHALGQLHRRQGPWPLALRDGGRHGITAADTTALRETAAALADTLVPDLLGGRVLVLGSEELMYLPLQVALALRWHADVHFSATTRSPVVVINELGYPIRHGLVFPAHDRASVRSTQPPEAPERFAYNIRPDRYTDIVLIIDDIADTVDLDAGLIPALRRCAGRLHVVTVPSFRPLPPPPPPVHPLYGPQFGSYQREEVSWLVTDLSDVPLEAPTEEREEAIQSGGAHYAESLPIEYQPTAEYQQLFTDALAASAQRVAQAVGLVTDLVLAERGRDVVLASLARAGTPVGVLMRRWAQYAHDLDLRHYTLSIVRGRGIDTAALEYLGRRYDPTSIVFVDGWTGKGAIVRELAQSVQDFGRGFVGELAVIADTGSCVSMFGTRDDFLIPSACLNSTVSGLVSRTVLNSAVLRPGEFHGAKYYRELADRDVSAQFVDAVSAQFPAVAPLVGAELPALRASDRAPTWAGWQSVEKISAEWGIGNVNLVKPGVGETTRVLLRRVPWRVLVRPGSEGELAHVLLLAEQRVVEVTAVPDLAYSCVGLIHPNFTRGATGADGKAASAGGDAQ